MKRFLASLGIIFATTVIGLGIGSALPTSAFAQTTPKDAVCDGLELTGGKCGAGADAQVSNTIEMAINIFSILVGVAAVIMIIIGGFKYVISSGDSAGVNSAKNTILFAVIGLVIVALAQIIVRFVINRTTTSITGSSTYSINA